MQLNSLLLRLTPLPSELDGEAGRYFDAFFPALFSLLETHADAKISLTLSGFLLEKLEGRARLGILKRVAEFSRSQIAIIKFPFFDPSRLLMNKERLEEQFQLQERFWNNLGGSIAPSIDLTHNSTLSLIDVEPSLFKGHIFLDTETVPNSPRAVMQMHNDLLVSPVGKIQVAKDGRFSPTAGSGIFPLTEKIFLRSIAISPEILRLHTLEATINAFKVLFAASDQGFMVPSEFVFSANAKSSLEKLNLPSPSEQNAISSRVSILWKGVEEAPTLIKNRLNDAKTENQRNERHGPTDVLDSAKRFAHRASNRSLDIKDSRAARTILELMLFGEVDLEAFLHPDVDPVLGWVRLGSVNGEHFISTQLADYFLAEDGALLELDFKPRKCALFGTVPARSFTLKPSAEPLKRKLETAKVTRKTLDLLSIRFDEELTYSTGTFHLIKEFTFRAGVGAHLPNSTTGFSLEYWIEGPAPSTLNISLLFSPTLPSPELHSGSVKPLLCVGGIDERRFTLEESTRIGGSDVPGGLFGIRLIDSVEDLLVDIRTSKQLEEAKVIPSSDKDIAVCEFTVGAKRISGDGRSNTVFVSVL